MERGKFMEQLGIEMDFWRISRISIQAKNLAFSRLGKQQWVQGNRNGYGVMDVSMETSLTKIKTVNL